MSAAEPSQLPIRDYGLLADGLTAALMGRDGGIGWLCVPRFDSPSIFATLLDSEGKGGVCRWAPAGISEGEQKYIDDTNVLVTEFGDNQRRVRITDWMPARFDGATAPGFGAGALCRWAEVVKGEVELELHCAPRPGYGTREVDWKKEPAPGPRAAGGAAARWRAVITGANPAGAPAGIPEDAALWAAASFALSADEGGVLSAKCKLQAGQSAWFALVWGAAPEQLDGQRVQGSLESTTKCWQSWAGKAQYQGPYRPMVVRSALALKALIYAPTGAIVAAPTASLPEAIGGARNWDYRYCWPRDATFALYGLSLLGYHDEAGRFLEFVAQLCDAHPPPLQVCYRVDGGTEVPEIELAHLGGYRGSRPVRIGNAAACQRQLDSYGEVLDAAYTYAKWRNGLDLPQWQVLVKLVEYAAKHWHDPDESIWEVRGGRQQFVYSKVLCWVALDRAVKLATLYKLPGAVERWKQVRDDIHQAVMAFGYNHEVHSFTQTFGSQVLDSSLLLLPLLRFLSPHEPRMHATIRRIQQGLSHNSLVARYENTDEDGIGGPEGAFSICTFWLVDCLTLLGRTEESRQLFERMLGHASPLGLYSEEVDAGSGAFLGNYPQAFTHMALLNSAHNLELYPGGVA